MVSDMSGVEEPSSRLKLLQHLTCNSEFLLDLRDELTEIWGALQVFSFYETKKTPTVGQEVRCRVCTSERSEKLMSSSPPQVRGEDLERR